MFVAMAVDDLRLTGALLAGLLGSTILALAGGAFLQIGRRLLAKQPGARYGESVATVVLAGFITVPVQAFIYHVASWLMGGRVAACLGAGLLAFLAGLLVFVISIKLMCQLSFAKAFLAWLPLLAVQVIQVSLVALLVITFQYAQFLVDKVACTSNLANVGQGIVLYKGANGGKWPAELKSLIGISACSPGTFLCPCMRKGLRPAGRTCDFFYFPPQSKDDPQTLVVCDFAGNHRDNSRSVLFADVSFRPLSAAEFQAELAKPVNAAFAKALREAEGVPATAPAVHNTSGGPSVPAGTSRPATVSP